MGMGTGMGTGTGTGTGTGMGTGMRLWELVHMKSAVDERVTQLHLFLLDIITGRSAARDTANFDYRVRVRVGGTAWFPTRCHRW